MGSIIRLVSGNKLLKYPDEVQFPAKYTSAHISRMETHMSQMQSRQGGGSNRPGLLHAQSRPHPELDGPAMGQGEMNEAGAKRQGAMAPGTDGMNANTEKTNVTGDQRTLTPPGTPMGVDPTRSDSETTVADRPIQNEAGARPSMVKREGQGQAQGQGEGRGQAQVQVQGEQPMGYQPAEGETYEDPNLVTWYGPDDPENP